ncbi:phosphoserine aminotransferase [Fistulifera solaris]|uniref:phosphoserine transaminase n=1 Tax=Fistulifera solaris TaxID=1519565 RepID=A0A1Z5J8A5_FISSO|nr:phosphoserine aminotransferase [Fistulifera solaris]|eukprot:GAX10220.1 phosphoserine aminotransferase [Fistulifera solaris]
MLRLTSSRFLAFAHKQPTFMPRVSVRMMSMAPPAAKPANPEFSSGPCKKRPGYNVDALDKRILGRSHRSKIGKERLALAIDESKRILGLPDDYLLGIVPASDTGAYEMAMWNMLGARNVDICYWESFGKGWYGDAVSHLKLKDLVEVNEFSADYGELPDLSKTNPDHDICFTFNGTTSGVRVPDGCDFISDDRTGLTLCDATSACFAMDMPWEKLDVTTYSWQKVLGGEGGHGVLILSPRAVERLETYVPENRPLPKIFRMTKKGKVDTSIFKGSTINTPSMLAVEDYIDALQWADSIGGVPGLKKLSLNNLAVIEKFVAENDWIDFLAKDPAIRSSTSVCCTLDLTAEQIKAFVSLLEKEGVALDIGGYRDAPPSIRIWCGSTVEQADVEALMPWLNWAYHQVKA